MSRMPPPRSPDRPVSVDFAQFVLPSEGVVFIRRSSVTCVYDNGNGVSNVVTASNIMPVPYSASQVMEILYGDP